jgi:DNA-binding transcriptional regulator YbjK
MSTTTATTFSARQQALLAAAVRVLARGGLRGLTHRAVDTEAGLPQGSTSAYMRTRLALLTRLTEYVTEHFARDIEELTQRIEAHPGVEGYAVQQTTEMLRSWLQEPEMVLARVELALEGSRQPEIAEITRSQLRDLENIVERAMTSGGHEHCQARAATLIAAVDGVLMHALREAPPDRAAYMREGLELLMGALAGEGPQPPATV